MIALVGHTGFVGSNIYASGKIDKAYNSKNIKESYGLKPDLLIYAGLRAEKYLANQDCQKDMNTILMAEESIKKIAPKQIALISTIDVYKNPIDVNEDSKIDTAGLLPYGLNRYKLELWVRKNYPNALIIRLPGLFGKNLKKNFIYDFINYIPFMLKEEKINELSKRNAEIFNFYDLQNNGFYKCKNLDENQKIYLKQLFKEIEFSALNFTDSRSLFQFYPLNRLWDDIQIALKHKITLLNPATEPIFASELYSFLTNETFENELSNIPFNYNYTTKHADLFGGTDKYIINKINLLNEIKRFIEEYSYEK